MRNVTAVLVTVVFRLFTIYLTVCLPIYYLFTYLFNYLFICSQ
jgi:hypothetical protein